MESEVYQPLSLELEYVRTIIPREDTYAIGGLDRRPTGDQDHRSPYLNELIRFNTGVQQVATVTGPGRIAGIQPRFGTAALVNVLSGDTIRVRTCVPDYIALSQPLDMGGGGVYGIEVQFDPDNVHEIEGELFLDFTGTVGEPGAE